MALFLLGGRFLKCRSDIKRVVTAFQPYCSSVVSGRKHVNGVDLYYEQTGRGKHALLLFPGILGCSQITFLPQMKSLNKERFTLVNWDPRGYGRSCPPARDFPPDFFERDAKDGVDLMKALGHDKFSVLGWCAGGITALIAAAKNPDLINQLVVWGAMTFFSQQDLKVQQALCDVSAWSPKLRDPLEEAYGAEGLVKNFALWMDSAKEIAKRPGGNICRELLPLISCPTFIFHGEKDMFCPITHSQFLLKHIKGSRLHLIPEARHSLHVTHADEFNKLVEDFLED
ncbi:valacyclovir hydrolase-like [Sebastes fasciatus]|uniref:valacyclovir hydrolase-like n=1 Tax=Sebastes fasciatus TaxID=394691 RepID=UPI003D9F8716